MGFLIIECEKDNRKGALFCLPGPKRQCFLMLQISASPFHLSRASCFLLIKVSELSLTVLLRRTSLSSYVKVFINSQLCSLIVAKDWK